MKLVLLFIVMDLFTVLAYPFVFIYARLYPADAQSEILNTRKKGIYA